MIEYIEGNIFDSPAQVIVNTVNTVGVMGKGLALEFKKRYPQMFEQYKKACESREFIMGKLMFISAPDHMILLFPTKENWRNPSKLSYIELGLKKFCDNYAKFGITSIAFPKLGCGNGELNWEDVRSLMEKYLNNLPIDVYVYLGNGKQEEPEHKNQKEMQDWLRKNAKDMSFNGVIDDISSQCKMLPYQYYIGKDLVELTENNDAFMFSYHGKNITIDKEKIFALWDDIRNKSIFKIDANNIEFLLFSYLLFALGYLTKIKKKDKNSDKMIDGFQLNEGLGRVYAFNEVK